eukprot:s4591_g1.t1
MAYEELLVILVPTCVRSGLRGRLPAPSPGRRILRAGRQSAKLRGRRWLRPAADLILLAFAHWRQIRQQKVNTKLLLPDTCMQWRHCKLRMTNWLLLRRRQDRLACWQDRCPPILT